MLNRLVKFNEAVSRWSESIALVAVLSMVAVTCVDVVGTKLFRLPVPGSLDLMMLAQLIAISFAASMTLARDRHVSVEFFVVLLPRRAQALIDCLVRLLCLTLFALIAWRLANHGYHLQTGGEETPTIQLPIAPFSYAAAIATVPVCLVFLQQLLGSIVKVLRDEP